VKRPMLEFQSENCNETLSSSSNSHHSQKEEKKSNHQQIIEECQQQICRITKADSESSTSKLKEEDDEEEQEQEDGFKTPTSLDHKIPLPLQCPPAPRKTQPSLKRKASYYNNHCNYCRHPLDLSKEVFELLFPTQHSNPLSASQQNTKKVRSQENK